MNRLLARLALTAIILNLVPLNFIQAASGDQTYELRGFRSNGATAVFVGDQQWGPVSLPVADPFLGSLGPYMEGMCVPMAVDLRNTGSVPTTLDTDIVFDSYHAGAGVPLFAGLEAMTSTVLGFDLALADNLEDFLFTGTPLASATITSLGSASLSLVVSTPVAGTRIIDGASPFTAPVETQAVNVSVADVPAGDTVRIQFCARLGQAVQQADHTMLVTLSDEPAEILRVRPGEVLEGPATVDSATIQGIIYSDINANASYDEDANDPATRFDGHVITLYDSNFVQLDSMLSGQANSNDNLNYASNVVIGGQYRFNNLPSGVYHICHATPAGSGWTRTAPTSSVLDLDASGFANISTITPPPGEVNECYTVDMTNVANQDYVRFGLQYVAPTTAVLTILKEVMGSNDPVGAFTYKLEVNGLDTSVTPFEVGGTQVTLQDGDDFEVRESDAVNYTETESANCAGTIVADQNITCTITNTYVPPKGTITLLKNLPNDNGGTETSANFDFAVGGNPVTLGVPVEYDPGQYTISESWNAAHYTEFPNTTTLDTWYDVSFSCTDGNTITTSTVVDLVADQDIVCTITNDDKSASITVIKLINGGPSVPASNFSFRVTGTDVVVDGTGIPTNGAVFAGSATGTQVVMDAGFFTLTEAPDANYLSLTTGECNGGILVPGQHMDCTFTNTYIVPPVPDDAWFQGYFYQDLNGNGTNDDGSGYGNRLLGVEVTLYDSAWVEIDSMLSGQADTNTNSAHISGPVNPGQYRFRYLPAGTYYICSADMNATLFDQSSPEAGFKDPVLGASPNVSSVVDPNVSGQFCYQSTIVADQHRNLMRFGFEPVNQNPTREVTGLKFEDENGDGELDSDEEGIEDWTMYLVTEAVGVSSFTVDSNSDLAAGNQDYFFAPGKTYVVRASGTFTAGDSITADAKYSVRDPNTAWTDLVQNYESEGPVLLELTLDGVAQNWGEYVDGHVYFTVVVGDDSTKTFSIDDIFPSNNVGGLDVQIFEVLQTTQTDEYGNYSFDITGVGGDLYVIEDTSTAGFVQTLPGNPNYLYTMPAGTSDVVSQDFGNQQIGRITPAAEIIPTLTCVEDVGQGNLSAHFGYVSANQGVVFIDADAFENRIVGGGLIGGTDHGQTSSFQPGTNADDFEVVFVGSIPLTWTVVSTNTNSVTADQNSAVCGPAQPPDSTLTVNVVISGGTATASSFHVFLNGAGVELAQGTPANLAPSDYTLLQTSTAPDYVTSFAGDCAETTTDHAAGTISLNEQAVCTITNTYVGQDSNGGGGGGGGGNGSGLGTPNNTTNNSNNDDGPAPIVLGDSDEADPTTDDSDAATETNDDSSGGLAPLPPLPIVAGVSDELPRTGVPLAGLLALGSALVFWARRRDEK